MNAKQTEKAGRSTAFARRACAGMTVVELLLGTTLAAVLMLSMVMLYFGAAQTAAKEENISSASREARMVTRRLARDFRLVGLMANEDVDGDSNDITRDVPAEMWSDSVRDDFEYAATYEVVYTSDIDNDDRTETVHLYVADGMLMQRTWEWLRDSTEWAPPVERVLGSQIDYLTFDYYDSHGDRIPDVAGYPTGGHILSEGERRSVTAVEVTVALRSGSTENRVGEHLEMPDGTVFNDQFRRSVHRFMIRGRNLSLGA